MVNRLCRKSEIGELRPLTPGCIDSIEKSLSTFAAEMATTSMILGEFDLHDRLVVPANGPSLRSGHRSVTRSA